MQLNLIKNPPTEAQEDPQDSLFSLNWMPSISFELSKTFIWFSFRILTMHTEQSRTAAREKLMNSVNSSNSLISWIFHHRRRRRWMERNPHFLAHLSAHFLLYLMWFFRENWAVEIAKVDCNNRRKITEGASENWWLIRLSWLKKFKYFNEKVSNQKSLI